jgi:hypothetical protein
VLTTTTTVPVTTTTTVSTTTTSLPPLPPSLPLASFGTRIMGTVASNGATLSGQGNGASALVSMPAGALPAGTTLSLVAVSDSAPLSAKVPGGQSYLASFASARKLGREGLDAGPSSPRARSSCPREGRRGSLCPSPPPDGGL